MLFKSLSIFFTRHFYQCLLRLGIDLDRGKLRGLQERLRQTEDAMSKILEQLEKAQSEGKINLEAVLGDSNEQSERAYIWSRKRSELLCLKDRNLLGKIYFCAFCAVIKLIFKNLSNERKLVQRADIEHSYLSLSNR